MKHRGALVLVFGFALLMLSSGPVMAGWPSSARLSRAVTKYWEKTWPDQELAHVTKKTDCEKTMIADEAYEKRTKKVRKIRACLVKADVFVAKGYRYFIYRDTFVYFVKRRIKSVQLGELEKAWKAGGVPAPGVEEAKRLLSDLAKEKMGFKDLAIEIHEMGTPRPHGEVYRITIAADVSYTQKGEQVDKKRVLSTLESDGTGWKAVAELAF